MFFVILDPHSKTFLGENMSAPVNLETYHPDLFYIMIQNAQDGRMEKAISELFEKEKILDVRMGETRHLMREFKNIAASMEKGDIISLEQHYADAIKRFKEIHFPKHQSDNSHCVTNDNNPFNGDDFESIDYNHLGDIIDKLEAVEQLDQFGVQKVARDLLHLSNTNAEIATMIAERFSKKNEMRTLVDNQISR